MSVCFLCFSANQKRNGGIKLLVTLKNMDPQQQNQLGIGWLWTPSGGGSGILFCNADQPGIVTTVASQVIETEVQNGDIKVELNGVVPHGALETEVSCVESALDPINFGTAKSPLSDEESRALIVPQSSSSVSMGDESIEKKVNGAENGEKSGRGSKTVSKQVLNEDELAKRRETNRLRERRRREQMTPKERAKARKKNRLRARKRRRNMTSEEREQEKERNRERARQRRAQKLQQEAEQRQQPN